MTKPPAQAQPIAIVASGLVTGVGLDAPSSCAAIRAAIDNFEETRFMDAGGEWIQGCEVLLEQPWRGTRKLAKMLSMALRECAEDGAVELANTPIILCLAEMERPGRLDELSKRVFVETREELGIQKFRAFNFVEHGRVGGLVALRQARAMLYQGLAEQVIVAGVDSLLSAPALRVYEEQDRLLTSVNSNGFIPGEGAAAVLVEKPKVNGDKQLLCTGLGFGVEVATIGSELPLRADGLVSAITESLGEAGAKMEDLDFRMVDVSGEHYWFKESSLALLRTLHVPQEEFDIWHPADCIGEVGAAIGTAMLIVAKFACKKEYSKGQNILLHFSNSNGMTGLQWVKLMP